MGGLGLVWLAPVGSVCALLFAWHLSRVVLRAPEGTDRMKEIARYVREGALAYLKRQYKVVGIFFLVVFLILSWMAWKKYLTPFVPFAFLTGGFFSGLSGFIGMMIATRASNRTAAGAQESLNKGLRVAFSAGAVMGLVVVGLGLLDLSIWFFLLNWIFDKYPNMLSNADKITAITTTMLTFGMGASSQALFARLGGGIYTKAADVGADLVGKIEAGIPEDDPRNPAVIADNVGDNVGDVAGMGADLYESYVGSIVATMALAATAGLGLAGVTVPMVMATCGVIASIFGTFLVHTKEDASQSALLWALRKGIFGSAILIAIASFFIVKFTLGMGFIGVYWAVISGLIAGIIIGLSTEYFTSANYKPTKLVAESAITGPATVILSGISVGMLSTMVPVLVVGAAIFVAFWVTGGFANPGMGLYGIGISAVGMLSTLGITLATDAYGPVADNAGGNAEMSGLPPEVRNRTDALDSLGNTTAATGKGFAIGSAALTAMALIAAYRDEIVMHGGKLNLSIMEPTILIGLFIGAMMPFAFSALTIRAVGRAAQGIVLEVRRQFKEIKGLMEGTATADYASCVNIATKSAQKEMMLPSLLAVATPIAVGIFLGVSAEVGLLAGALASGFALAVFMANAGGTWDNAKKYIEEGNFGGKGSDAHKAAVVGDTVGDPFKDTSGPSINILIKLMSMVSIVFASFIISNTFIK